MYFKFDIFNSQQQPIGSSSVSLDWGSHVWLVTEDKSGAWKRVTDAKSGKFEFKDWGVLWMWDKVRNIAIVWDTPKSVHDFSSIKGMARLYKPVDTTLEDTIMNWSLDPGKTGKAIAILNSPLPFSRTAYLQRLNWLMPAPYGSMNYKILADNLSKDDPKVKSAAGHYTTCGSLPGFVSKQVATSKGLKGQAFLDWVTKFSLNGTNRVREQGMKLGCWVEATPTKRPKPGDIYALLNRGETDKKISGISHVGVVEDGSGKNWKTIDLGQAGGFDGCKNEREYKQDTCELSGEINQGGGFRTVAGWLDLEGYFKA